MATISNAGVLTPAYLARGALQNVLSHVRRAWAVAVYLALTASEYGYADMSIGNLMLITCQLVVAVN